MTTDSYSEAQARAIKKYLSEKVETIQLRVPAGRKDEIKEHARQQGESMNAFIVRAIDETTERDNSNCVKQ